jgi:hypothetical protein
LWFGSSFFGNGLRGSLKRLGYTVLQAGNELETLAVADQHSGKIDIVVTDSVTLRISPSVTDAGDLRTTPDRKFCKLSGSPDRESVFQRTSYSTLG